MGCRFPDPYMDNFIVFKGSELVKPFNLSRILREFTVTLKILVYQALAVLKKLKINFMYGEVGWH